MISFILDLPYPLELSSRLDFTSVLITYCFLNISRHLYIKKRMSKANGKYICEVITMIIASMIRDCLDKNSYNRNICPTNTIFEDDILLCSNFRVETRLFDTWLDVEKAI